MNQSNQILASGAKVKLPPSALTAEACPTLSDKYVHIDTRQVVHLMKEHGWYVAAASAASPRKRDPLFAKHTIDFRHPDMKEHFGAAPRVVFVNSHDGSSSARAMAGYFRFVCSNGLIVGRPTASVRARHAGLGAYEFVHEVQALRNTFVEQQRTFSDWSKLQTTKAQREEYARLVGQLRWGDAYAFNADELLSLRRAEDDDGSLLTTFNRAQENATRGGLSGLSRNGRILISQPISSIDRDLKFNADLWQLTEEFAGVIA